MSFQVSTLKSIFVANGVHQIVPPKPSLLTLCQNIQFTETLPAGGVSAAEREAARAAGNSQSAIFFFKFVSSSGGVSSLRADPVS